VRSLGIAVLWPWQAPYRGCTVDTMPDRSRKRPRDLNELAASIVQDATDEDGSTPDVDDGKDPAAVALGRRGGLKGGRARADKLTAEQRAEAARRAAAARWQHQQGRDG
jgi:hypothetical protein